MNFLMITRFLFFSLFVTGGFMILGFSASSFQIPDLKQIIYRLSEFVHSIAGKKSKRETAKDIIDRINGTTKENIFVRSRREAQSIYSQTGQSRTLRKTIVLSWAAAAAGGVVGLTMHNVLLAAVLAMGGYCIPLWWSQFDLYRYERYVNEELEIALSLITTSYSRNNDILAAVEENINSIHSPVQMAFIQFINGLKYINPNAPQQIEKLKDAFDSNILHQWCDALILCQEDHTLRATLPPIVAKFSTQKAQQEANKTKMMMPTRQTVRMIALVLSFIPMFKMMNADWYANLVNTLPGQASLIATAVVSLHTINVSIRLSKPVEYNV